MAGGRLHKDKDLKNTKSLDPNLRDEGAGFFSTLYTAGSNLGTDALQEIAYIAQAVARPIDTGEAILRVVAGYAQKGLPDSWEAYLPEDWQTNKMYAEAINEYYADKYGSLEKAADSFAEKPVSVALDVFAVKAVISAVARQAAKKAAVTTKLATTAEGTVLQGELAARAAAESAIAKETAGTVERVVKHEGKLVFDRELGAYVPESSVGQAARSADEIAIAQETAAPIIADVVEKTPTVKPAVLADDVADVSVNQADGVALREAVKEAKKNERKVDDVYQDVHANEGEIAGEAFYLSDVIPAKAALIDAEIAELAIDSSIGAQRLTREAKIRKIALEQDIRNTEATTIYNASLSDAEFAAQAKLYPLIDDAMAANMVRNGLDEAAVARNQSLAAAMQEALAARTANRTTAIDSTGNRGADGSFLATIPDNLMEGKLSTVAAGYPDHLSVAEAGALIRSQNQAKQSTIEAKIARVERELAEYERQLAAIPDEIAGTTRLDSELGNLIASSADELKLLRNEKAMADNAPMSAEALQMENAMQPELFSQGSAAAYEQAQAAKIANDVRSAAEFSKTGNTGMMGVTLPETRLATRQPKYVDNTPVSKFTPVSVPKPIYSSSRGWKKPEIDDYKAAALVGQRISSATQANTELPAFDNEAFDIPILGNDVVTNPDYTKPVIKEEAPVVQERRPGWRQGNTYENDDGNFWSADFDHEHWNTPAGVNEAISIWGRPMGSRHSWETPAAIKSQYTNRQPADWSWMNEY